MDEMINSETSFGVFSVLKSSFWVSVKNIRLLSVLLAILVALTILIDNALGDLQESYEPSSPISHVGNWLVFLKVVLDIMLLKVALVYSTFRSLNGKPPSFQKIFNRVRSYKANVAAIKLVVISLIYFMIVPVFAVLLLGIVISVIIKESEPLIGSYLFLAVCYGFWVLLTKYYVVIPVAIIERKSVVASFSRARDLTADYKWDIFCLMLSLFLLVFVAFLLIIFVLEVLVYIAGWDKLLEASKSGMSYIWPFVVTFLGSLFAILDGVATTVAYVRLKDELGD